MNTLQSNNAIFTVAGVTVEKRGNTFYILSQNPILVGRITDYLIEEGHFDEFGGDFKVAGCE